MLGMSGMGMGSVALAALMHSDAVRADQVHFKPRMDLLPSKTHFPRQGRDSAGHDRWPQPDGSL